MPEDTLKKRYLYKLSSNLITLGINVFVQAVVPRGLGPKSYGDFSFITNFFQQIISFFDLWSTPGFFIKFSQRQKEFGLVVFTFYFVGICSLILVLGLFIIPPGSVFFTSLLPGQDFVIVILAAIFALVTWVSQIFNNMTDAYGLTVKSEIGRVLQKVLSFTLVLSLYLLNKLNIISYFYSQYIVILFLIFSFIWIIRRNRGNIIEGWKISLKQVKGYLLEFYKFSYPLFTIGLFGLITGVLDRWLLQKFGGSVEQGYFGVSNQVGIVCFLFTSAMTPLIMREFSIASLQKDINKIAVMFRQYVPMLFSITAYISCFLIVQADKVTFLLGGSEYRNAALAVGIMCFYPIHQTYGQLNGSVFMATGQTKIYSKIGVLFMILGIPVTYFLIADKSLIGINAGATGLAIKMVAIQLVVVNVQLYFIAKYLNINFWKYLGHQILCISSLLILSVLTLFFEKFVFNSQKAIIVKFLFSGVIYSIAVGLLVYLKPVIFGLTRNNIDNLAHTVFSKFHKLD